MPKGQKNTHRQVVFLHGISPSPMLSSLHIKDFTIIDELWVELSPGLNIMTGETGAGKTIIIEALQLILGERASPDIIRAGKERAAITAIFGLEGAPAAILRQLKEAGIEDRNELIIHRLVGEGGKGKITVNGVPVTGTTLKSWATHLVDISSQHEHQLLLSPSEHASIVDAFGGHGEAVSRYRNAHNRWALESHEVRELEANEQRAKEQLDFLQFQLREIESAKLKTGEEETLEAECSRLRHITQLEERTRAAEAILYSDAGSAIELIDRAKQLITQCLSFDPTLSRFGEAIDRARAELTCATEGLSQYTLRLESNPAHLEDLDNRLHLIRSLARKYGGSIESCLAKLASLQKEIDTICRYDEILEKKRTMLTAITKERREAAFSLRTARQMAGLHLSKRIEEELSGLGMNKARFSVKLEERPEEAWDESGAEQIEFLFVTNIGEPLRPLARIASGGELSRVMLAIKGALAKKGNHVLASVFDEVDAGIGGATAAIVGKKLKAVAENRQVICITHLPQVAVYGDIHLMVSKRVEEGRTIATLTRLVSEDRIQEIARMLGGTKITTTTIAHAREMLRQAQITN